jgi:hypothetical protein
MSGANHGATAIIKISHGRLDHSYHCFRGRGRLAPRIRFSVLRARRPRIGGQYVVEIDADIRKLAKDRRGKAELRAEEIAVP